MGLTIQKGIRVGAVSKDAPQEQTVGATRLCRWPMWPTGDYPTQEFCCLPALDGKSYCEKHHRIGTVKAYKLDKDE